jgi:hypothetical protein
MHQTLRQAKGTVLSLSKGYLFILPEIDGLQPPLLKNISKPLFAPEKHFHALPSFPDTGQNPSSHQ